MWLCTNTGLWIQHSERIRNPDVEDPFAFDAWRVRVEDSSHEGTGTSYFFMLKIRVNSLQNDVDDAVERVKRE